jgi:hypothetical protein
MMDWIKKQIFGKNREKRTALKIDDTNNESFDEFVNVIDDTGNGVEEPLSPTIEQYEKNFIPNPDVEEESVKLPPTPPQASCKKPPNPRPTAKKLQNPSTNINNNNKKDQRHHHIIQQPK